MIRQLHKDLIEAPKTWLVTGVAGFIGSNLLETLLQLNQKVTGLDNFATGHRHNLDDPANRPRFKHEARAAAILDHTAICKVFDFEESDDDAYIAMAFVEGDNLQSIKQ